MALQTSGPISLNDMHVEVGGSSNSLCSVNDADIRDLISRGANTSQSFLEYYGKSAETSLPTGGSTINGQVQLKQITASDYISSGGTLRIPSNMWVWSDNTSVAALIIDISCTVINDGKIIGKGGNGASYSQNQAAGVGGPAINVTASGVSITNSSGAYIAGGGGGGGGRWDGGNASDSNAGGGGGAGGGNGGNARSNGFIGGTGGALNAKGGNEYRVYGNTVTYSNSGGGAGGAGGDFGYGGGGGGRQLPGVGGTLGGVYASQSVLSGGFEMCEGGSGGGVGHGPNPTGYAYSDLAAGGGGWGAAGGNGTMTNGAAGGAAITGTSRSLSNSGTIYGST